MKNIIAIVLAIALLATITIAFGDTLTWVCSCGSSNTGDFCGNCGHKRPFVLNTGKWECTTCGNINTTNFCTKCSAKKQELQGSIVTFGTYDDKPIEWTIADVDDSTILLVAVNKNWDRQQWYPIY